MKPKEEFLLRNVRDEEPKLKNNERNLLFVMSLLPRSSLDGGRNLRPDRDHVLRRVFQDKLD